MSMRNPPNKQKKQEAHLGLSASSTMDKSPTLWIRKYFMTKVSCIAGNFFCWRFKVKKGLKKSRLGTITPKKSLLEILTKFDLPSLPVE